MNAVADHRPAAPVSESFGSMIRRRRREIEISQRELGEQVGWNGSGVQLLEASSRGVPDLARATALVDALDFPDPVPILARVIHERGEAAYPVDPEMLNETTEFFARLALAHHRGELEGKAHQLLMVLIHG